MKSPSGAPRLCTDPKQPHHALESSRWLLPVKDVLSDLFWPKCPDGGVALGQMIHPCHSFHLLSAVDDRPVPETVQCKPNWNIADIKSFDFAKSKHQGRVRIGPGYQTDEGQCRFMAKAANGSCSEWRSYLLALELSSKEMLNQN